MMVKLNDSNVLLLMKMLVMKDFRHNQTKELDTMEIASDVVLELAQEIDNKHQVKTFIDMALNDLSKLYKTII